MAAAACNMRVTIDVTEKSSFSEIFGCYIKPAYQYQFNLGTDIFLSTTEVLIKDTWYKDLIVKQTAKPTNVCFAADNVMDPRMNY